MDKWRLRFSSVGEREREGENVSQSNRGISIELLKFPRGYNGYTGDSFTVTVWSIFNISVLMYRRVILILVVTARRTR